MTEIDLQQWQIIDNFITVADSLRFTPVKEDENTYNQEIDEYDTPLQMSIASEKLAQIFVKQKKNRQAIEIYKRLILKYPNKTTYFADLISKYK